MALESEIGVAARGGAFWGIASLAVGADQMFADLVLRADGMLHVVIPSARYETAFDRHGLRRYQLLVRAAMKIEQLEFNNPTEEAYFAAGRRVVDLCDTLLAVWDGQPALGLGGAADVVQYAQSLGRRVDVIWPTGVAR